MPFLLSTGGGLHCRVTDLLVGVALRLVGLLSGAVCARNNEGIALAIKCVETYETFAWFSSF